MTSTGMDGSGYQESALGCRGRSSLEVTHSVCQKCGDFRRRSVGQGQSQGEEGRSTSVGENKGLSWEVAVRSAMICGRRRMPGECVVCGVEIAAAIRLKPHSWKPGSTSHRRSDSVSPLLPQPTHAIRQCFTFAPTAESGRCAGCDVKDVPRGDAADQAGRANDAGRSPRALSPAQLLGAFRIAWRSKLFRMLTVVVVSGGTLHSPHAHCRRAEWWEA